MTLHSPPFQIADSETVTMFQEGGTSELWEAALELGPPETWVAISDELVPENLRKCVYVTSDALGIDPQHMLWLLN